MPTKKRTAAVAITVTEAPSKKKVQALNLDITAEVAEATKAIAPALKRLTKTLTNLQPKELPVGALSDLLYDMRQMGKLLNTIQVPFTDIIDPTIKLVEEHFIQTLEASEASGVQGQKSRVQVTTSVIPTVEDWTLFYDHIRKTKSFELLNRAVNRAAVTERWDAKKQVPGIGKFTAKKVSCTKLSGK